MSLNLFRKTFNDLAEFAADGQVLCILCKKPIESVKHNCVHSKLIPITLKLEPVRKPYSLVLPWKNWGI